MIYDAERQSPSFLIYEWDWRTFVPEWDPTRVWQRGRRRKALQILMDLEALL